MENEKLLIEFDYRPKFFATYLLSALGIFGMFMFFYFSVSLNRPIDLEGMKLTVAQGRIFFRVLAYLSIIGIILHSGMVFLTFTRKRRVAFTSRSILVPKPTRIGLSFEEIAIPFDSIQAVSIRNFIGKTKVLRIEYTGGIVNIPSNMVVKLNEFSQLCELIQKCIKKSNYPPSFEKWE